MFQSADVHRIVHRAYAGLSQTFVALKPQLEMAEDVTGNIIDLARVAAGEGEYPAAWQKLAEGIALLNGELPEESLVRASVVVAYL